MLDIQALSQVTHIVVHDNCADGTASALILKQVLPKAKVTFAQYNTDLIRNLPAEPGILFCDFTPPLDRAQEFIDAGALVADHHGGAAGAVTRMFQEKGQGVFRDEPGVSGAVLAFYEVFIPLYGYQMRLTAPLQQETTKAIIKDFAEAIGVYDTWQTKHPKWKQALEYTEAVRFWPFETMLNTDCHKWCDLWALGPVLVAQREASTEKAIKLGYSFTSSKGKKVFVTQGTSKQVNLLADKVGGTHDLVLGFGYLFEDGVQKMVCSSRSRGSFSCRALAMAFGGGGHISAAGFSQVLTQRSLHPYQYLQDLVKEYESVEEEWLKIFSDEGFEEKVKNGEIKPQKLFKSLSETEVYEYTERTDTKRD